MLPALGDEHYQRAAKRQARARSAFIAYFPVAAELAEMRCRAVRAKWPTINSVSHYTGALLPIGVSEESVLAGRPSHNRLPSNHRKTCARPQLPGQRRDAFARHHPVYCLPFEFRTIFKPPTTVRLAPLSLHSLKLFPTFTVSICHRSPFLNESVAAFPVSIKTGNRGNKPYRSRRTIDIRRISRDSGCHWQQCR